MNVSSVDSSVNTHSFSRWGRTRSLCSDHGAADAAPLCISHELGRLTRHRDLHLDDSGRGQLATSDLMTDSSWERGVSKKKKKKSFGTLFERIKRKKSVGRGTAVCLKGNAEHKLNAASVMKGWGESISMEAWVENRGRDKLYTRATAAARFIQIPPRCAVRWPSCRRAQNTKNIGLPDFGGKWAGVLLQGTCSTSRALLTTSSVSFHQPAGALFTPGGYRVLLADPPRQIMLSPKLISSH